MKAGSGATAAEIGRALCASFSTLLAKDLDTRPVAAVHDLVGRCMRAVDPAFTPYLFGSTAVYGFHEPGTDADFVVLSPADVQAGTAADHTSEVAKAVQSDLLAKLATALTAEQNHSSNSDSSRAASAVDQSPSPASPSVAARGLGTVELVRRTRVPVLRVKDSIGVDFDVTANRRNGVRNSALLRRYFEQQPETRWLSVAVKQWSKRSGLNLGVEGGCLTSYGFNLMVVYYLLRRGIVQYVPPDSCDAADIAPMPSYLPLRAPAHDGRELGEMVLDFLGFYLSEFNADREVISLSRGFTQGTPASPFHPALKEELRWTRQAEDMGRIAGEKVNYRWCIEDPYEVNLNVGRYVTPFKLMLLKKHLERARDTALLLNMPAKTP